MMALWGLAAGAAGAAASVSSNHARFVTSIATPVGDATYRDHQSVSMSPSAHGPLLDLSAFPWSRRVGINAFSVTSNLLMFVPDVDFVQDGVTYTRRDVVAYNPVTATFAKHFDGVSAGIPAHAGIDALHVVWGGAVAFSLDVPAVLPVVGPVRQHDFLFWNGSSFGLQLSGEVALGLPADANVNALFVNTNLFTWFFSLDKPLSGARERDIWRIPNIVVPSLELVPGPVVPPGVDLVGLDFPVDLDGDGLSDFEEFSGYDEPSTTWPGTSVPLNPAGNITDPLLADTDGDGFSDAEEAMAGTDPNDDDDYLRFLAIGSGAPDKVEVTWRSEAGRQYALYGVVEAGGGLLNQDWQWIANRPGAPAQTTFTNSVLTADGIFQIRLVIQD
ncbi:MAG TPA: thrombospondin type 3 repeat-containing protein [Kiritimatiellia bacterium]|nr:thrombospondin type 3 repeat-containing protein [Kiritimatiellia bacterium]HMO98047.1 thrombospondin type 3 repeat-containing protein [Kiritimatiellia bacterium]HMP97399.1 thrombospondin type 3 repeat-containing protein [Kiritimatiellia bacterium]